MEIGCGEPKVFQPAIIFHQILSSLFPQRTKLCIYRCYTLILFGLLSFIVFGSFSFWNKAQFRRTFQDTFPTIVNWQLVLWFQAAGLEPTANYSTQISPSVTIHQHRVLPEIWISYPQLLSDAKINHGARKIFRNLPPHCEPNSVWIISLHWERMKQTEALPPVIEDWENSNLEQSCSKLAPAICVLFSGRRKTGHKHFYSGRETIRVSQYIWIEVCIHLNLLQLSSESLIFCEMDKGDPYVITKTRNRSCF